MTTTYTPELNLAKPQVNGAETENTWGFDLNENADKIDAFAAGIAASLTVGDEQIDDRVAQLLKPGVNVSLAYNDVGNTLTIAAPGDITILDPGEGQTFFATRTHVTTATIGPAIQTFRTGAFADPWDKGGGEYERMAAPPPAPWSSSNPGFVQSADGAWWRLAPLNDVVRIEQFGGKADYNRTTQTGSDNWQALTDALNYYSRVLADALHVRWCYTIQFGIGGYWFSAGFDLHVQHHIRGMGQFNQGTLWHTNLYFPPTVRQAFIHGSDQTWGEGASGGPLRGVGSGTLEGFAIKFPTWERVVQSSTTEIVAALWMRVTSVWRDIGIFNSPGKAFMIRATAGGTSGMIGNANDWVMRNCYVHTAGWDALKLEGNDVNAGICDGFITHSSIQGSAIHIDNGYPNTFIGLQLTGYRNRGWHYQGRLYHYIGSPSHRNVVPGTNNNVWYFVKNALDETIAATPADEGMWVEWQGAGYYYTPGCAIFARQAGPTFIEPYVEGAGAIISHCLGRVFGGNANWTTMSNVIDGTGLNNNVNVGWGTSWSYGDAQGMYARQGRVAPYLGSDLDPYNGEPLDAIALVRMGGSRGLTAGASLDWSDGASGVLVFSHYRDRDRTNYQYYYTNQDDIIYSNGYSPAIWRVPTFRSTSQRGRFGGTVQVPHQLILSDTGFASHDNTEEVRVLGQRASAPSGVGFYQKGQHNRGTRFFNRNPTVGGTGWFVCTTSGALYESVWTSGNNHDGTALNSAFVLAPNGKIYKALNEGIPSTDEPTHASGTVTYPDGKIWAWAGDGPPVYTPVADVVKQGLPYSATNVTPDRSFNADTVAITELADVVGTLIADLKLAGVLS